MSGNNNSNDPKNPQLERSILSPERAALLVSGWHTDPIDRWRMQQRQAAFIRPKFSKYDLARQAVRVIRQRLEALGLWVDVTSHKCAWDLEVEGCLLVEIKASRWYTHSHRGGRYQANLRRRQLANCDLIIFSVLNHAWHHFIIPAEQITVSSVTITSQDVNRYTGRWSANLEAWHLFDQALAEARRRGRQLNFSQERTA